MSFMSIAAATLVASNAGSDVLAIAFIIGATVMVGALVYGIFANGAMTFDDNDADPDTGGNPAHRSSSDEVRR